MQWNMSDKLLPNLGAFTVAMLLAASISYWILQWPQAASAAVGTDARVSTELSPPDVAAIGRLLGATGAAEPVAEMPATINLRLLGTVARRDGPGAATISVDGKPARTYIVGGVLPNGWVLQSVERGKASFSASPLGPLVQTLELPPPRAGN
jgi:general secretion pathway protein C